MAYDSLASVTTVSQYGRALTSTKESPLWSFHTPPFVLCTACSG